MSQNLLKRIITSIVLLLLLIVINFSHQYIFILSILILGVIICIEANNLFSKLLKINKNKQKHIIEKFNFKFLILNITKNYYIKEKKFRVNFIKK